jgi:hypothetical protein
MEGSLNRGILMENRAARKERPPGGKPGGAKNCGHPARSTLAVPADILTPPRTATDNDSMEKTRMLNRREFLKYAGGGSAALLGLSYLGLLSARRTDEQFLEQVATFSRSHRPPTPLSGITDYKGVVHVHTNLSPDCAGTPEEVIEAAQSNDLHFVVTTDHNHRDLFSRGLDGTVKDIVVVRGAEIETDGQDLLAIGIQEYIDGEKNGVAAVVRAIKAQGGLAFACRSHEFRAWDVNGLDGLEVYDVSDTVRARPWKLPLMLADRITPGKPIPEQVFIRGPMARPDAAIEQWDRLAGARRLVGLAGNDAHNNIRLFGRLVDPYPLDFAFVQTHLLASAPDRDSLLAALRAGHSYWSFALLADATGFQFSAAAGTDRRLMGDEVALAQQPVLSVRSPQRGVIRLYHNGELIREETTDRMEQVVQAAGTYRVEAFLNVDGTQHPWIFTNPIYAV